MNPETTVTKSGSFIVSQINCARKPEISPPPPSGPAITISQQTGSGAHSISELTAKLLQETEPAEVGEWKVFDRQLVERALEEHQLPARFAKYMPEDRRSYIQDVMEELFGLRPPSWVLVPQVAETIVHLVQAGHVIVVGRGSTVLASGMPGVFHVRLVASLANRIERVQMYHSLTRKAAEEYVEREDRGSRRYVKAHFNARIEDELLYHLIINTDRISLPEAARLIADGARRCFENDARLRDQQAGTEGDSNRQQPL